MNKWIIEDLGNGFFGYGCTPLGSNQGQYAVSHEWQKGMSANEALGQVMACAHLWDHIRLPNGETVVVASQSGNA